MNKILKTLIKLSSKERKNTEWDIELITARKFENLDIKKLKGFDDLYRAKRGQVRIIFSIKPTDVKIIKVDKRNDNTYKNL